ELASENAVPIERSDTSTPAIGGGGTPGGDAAGDASTATTIRRQVEEEAPPKKEGLVSVDDFDTTLYFLDDKEIEYLHKEIEREYAQDLRGNVLGMLFDLLELQTYGTVRAELISILENFIPYLLGAGDFRSVAFILRECKVIMQRARELIPEHRKTLEGLPARLSQPDALSQLLQSLDEATSHPTEEELSDLFTKLSNERVRNLVQNSAERLAQVHAAEVLKALASSDPAVQLEMVRLAGRLKLPGAPDGMGPLLERGERDLKLAVVEALTTIGSPGATRLLEKAIDDSERDVRISAVKFLGT